MQFSKNTIEKDKLLACEEENTYNEMSDIAFIVERKLKLDNKNCSSLGMGIKYEIKDLNNRLITILKKYIKKIFK